MFKSIDYRLAKLGFTKVQDDENMVVYERIDAKHQYTQQVCICYKASGRHIIQSYDKDLFDAKFIGNSCVGLTGLEMKLLLRKMRKKGWYSK